MKTYLTALLSLLISPVLAFAVLDVTLSESSVVSVGGYSLVVSGSASIDSILVDTSSFSVQLSPVQVLPSLPPTGKHSPLLPPPIPLRRLAARLNPWLPLE